MESNQKVLSIHANTGFYKVSRYKVGEFFGPVDLGLHLSRQTNSLNIGVGLLAGSIFPGSNRLMFTGFSPCWKGFYISSMGGAGLVFDNLGINMLSIVGKAHTPSILYLNRTHGEEIQVEKIPVNAHQVWNEGRKGVYGMMDHTYKLLGHRYKTLPRVLAVGPGSENSDVGAICSVPINKDGTLSDVDTWAGRGGLGSKLFQEHRIVAIIYGGTFIEEDFRDRKVADKWFVNKYQKRLAAKDMDAVAKYRYKPEYKTGGTFGVNYTTLKGQMMSFNYKSIYMTEEERLKIHKEFVVDHYLKQFNEETIEKKQQKTCGEPCAALCKKMNGKFKKDYEPYQTMGPQSGIFDQRAAEKINHHADMLGFDGISIGGVVSWLLECLDEKYITPEEIGVSTVPKFNPKDFDVVETSMHNANLGVEILDSINEKRGILDLSEGARRFARELSIKKGNRKIIDCFVHVGFGRDGWMVPNQYWVPGALSPMPIMGKYYMHYGSDFRPPRKLGITNAERLVGELVCDNIGICRFHRAWAEEMIPDILESLYGEGMAKKYMDCLKGLSEKLIARNASTFWDSERNIDYVHTFLKRTRDVEKNDDPEIERWIKLLEEDKYKAAFDFWYEIHKGIQETMLTQFNDLNTQPEK